MTSKSLAIAKSYLGKKVNVKIDRPLGSVHPRFEKIKYTANYGYLPETLAPDGEELDAYLLGLEEPVSKFEGIVIAIVHRLTDDDDKLIVVPEGKTMSDKEIADAVNFQEKWSGSKYKIITTK